MANRPTNGKKPQPHTLHTPDTLLFFSSRFTSSTQNSIANTTLTLYAQPSLSMKTTTKAKTKKAAKVTLPASTNRGPLMHGSEVLVASLEREGVDTIFAYPGGASQFLHQALTKSKKIRTILPRHEQGGGFMAAGYSRATGKVGVCMATSGPGATNVVTAIADCFMDSIPLVVVTGQVPSYNIGKGAFQETDFFGLTLPVVKHSYLVMNARDI